MNHWDFFQGSLAGMYEHSGHATRDQVLPATSGEWKRNLSAGDGYDDHSKRRYTDTYSTMSSPTHQTEAGTSSPRASYRGVRTSSYPVSSLYYSPYRRDDEVGYYESGGSQYRDSSTQLGLSYVHFADSNGGYNRRTEAGTRERSSFPSYDTSVTEQGYPEQYGFHQDPYYQESDVGRRNHEVYPPMPSYEPAPTNRDRFNLSRYQLDNDDDLLASVPDQSAVNEDVKPNRFKTQRKRIMKSKAEESEESDSTGQGYNDTRQTFGGEDSPSSDTGMSQRERLRRFSAEYSHHVVIPNQWEGEKRLQDFVSFGNIETAMRPLGFTMARTALINDSMTSRHHCSSSSGISPCHSNHSNPLASQS